MTLFETQMIICASRQQYLESRLLNLHCLCIKYLFAYDMITMRI